MIIYIHGFGSSGDASKAKAFRDYFKSIEEPFIAPSLSYVPELAIKTLEELIESYHSDVKLIGSSLGGYYAIYLAQKYDLQVVLINPSINPEVTLKRALGDAPNFYDESHYEWKEDHIEMLNAYKAKFTCPAKSMLLLQKGDELLDYSEALQYLPNVKRVVEEGGSHSFDGIERHFEAIRIFFEVGNHFKHTMKVKGIGFSNKELANRVGDLYYDALADFLKELYFKLSKDARSDRSRGRKKLADALDESAKTIQKSIDPMQKAWNIVSLHVNRWMKENGYNRMPDVYIDEECQYHFEFDSRDQQINIEVLIDTLKRDGWFVQVDDMPGAMPFERDEWRNYTDKIYTIRKERQYFSVNVVNNNAHVMMYVHYNDDVKAFVEEVFVAKFKGLA